MRPFWYIQSSGIKRNDGQNKILIDGLKHSGTHFTDFGVIGTELTNWQSIDIDLPLFPYCSTNVLKVFIEEKTDPKDIFVGASTETADFLYNKFKQGIFFDELKFDMSYQSNKEGLAGNLLNAGSKIWSLETVYDSIFEDDVFFRPVKDLKLFSGCVVPRGKTLKEILIEQRKDGYSEEFAKEKIIANRKIDIVAEFRFFVVDGEIAACSWYRKNNMMFLSNALPSFVEQKANEYIKIYQPAEAFVIDLCIDVDLVVKIVEYNCINCSGLYHCDSGKISNLLANCVNFS